MQKPNQQETSAILVQELLKEKRADRRWKNIRFITWVLLFTYIAVGSFHYIAYSSKYTAKSGKYAALIRLDGMIAPGRGFSAEDLIPTLHDAFTDDHAVGVVIDINSPGGTPVQAAIIHDAILAYKHKYHKKVIVIGEDLLTSGAYFVAVSADKIYVNPNTLTGSIGVIMKGFGFVDIMKKIGIERRVYVSGNDKDRLDPFLPQSPDDLKKIQTVMAEVHQHFVQAVIQGRQGKLHTDGNTLFNGDFWSGQTALKLGLVDGLGNLMDVMEKEFNTTDYKEYGDTTSNFFKLLEGRITNAFDSLFYVYT
jgi:protease-4